MVSSRRGGYGLGVRLANILIVIAGLDPAIHDDATLAERLHGCAGQARA
jgi:hypothetical protein